MWWALALFAAGLCVAWPSLLGFAAFVLVVVLLLLPRQYRVSFPFSAARKRRVLVVGGGAAGVAASWSLARFPELFDVEVRFARCTFFEWFGATPLTNSPFFFCL